MAPALKTFFLQVLPTLLIFILLAIVLGLLNIASKNPDAANNIQSWLYFVSGLALLLLTLLVLGNLTGALYRLHQQHMGSRFMLRLMTGFIILSLFPAAIVVYFSMNSLGDRIDSWFDVQIEHALQDSLDLARNSLQHQQRRHADHLMSMAAELRAISSYQYGFFLSQNQHTLGAHEIVLFGENQRIIASSMRLSDSIIPHFPKDAIFQHALKHDYIGLEPLDDELFSRVALRIQTPLDKENMVLTALFPLSKSETDLAESIQDGLKRYESLEFQRNALKNSFRLLLLLVMILVVLFSIWMAFIFSRRLVRPLQELAEGTRAVASGDLQKKLPVELKNDFRFLSQSFNEMTARLSQAQEEAQRSQHQVLRQNIYLNTVLEHIISGVITLDNQVIIRRVNSAVENILQLQLRQDIGNNLQDVCQHKLVLEPIWEKIETFLTSGQEEWQTEITLPRDSNRQVLVCRGTTLPASHNVGGYVLVFDDVTELIQAEHDAAWSEVARRLAHEIKNPLTPIQLSAERLQRKLLSEITEDKSRELLKRLTNTIVQQVDVMKTMVNAFSEYARAPALNMQSLSVNSIIRDISELYRQNRQGAELRLDLQDVPLLQADITRLRQLLINLIKNALEAIEGANNKAKTTTHEKPFLEISSEYNEQQHSGYIMISIRDNGPGIDEKLLPRLFEPYISSKSKGSGLGLAIVKKIVEEHNGRVLAKNHSEKGAIIVIQLPVIRSENATGTENL